MSDYNDIYGNNENGKMPDENEAVNTAETENTGASENTDTENVNTVNTENTEAGSGYTYSGADNVNTGYTYGNPGGQTQYGYSGNGPDNGAPRYTYETKAEKKKHHVVVPVIIAAVAVIGLAVGGSFVVSGLKKPSGKAETSENIKTTLASADNDTSTSSDDDTETQTVSLTKKDADSAEIATVDTSSNGTVITDVSSVVEDVMPCVVAITDNLEVTSNYNPYSYFFGNGSSGQYGQSDQNDSYDTVASGSGVILGMNDTELLIVTNNHVVDNEGNSTSYSVASKGLTVQFCDDSTASATIKGTDSSLDLAIVSVDLTELSDETKNAIRIAVVGSSDDAKVGEGVICIGNAMGYGQSVTTGIISAKDRSVTFSDGTRVLMQTDAAINPGNSGGGMFNAEGELIGINAAKYTDTDVEGMCFAIPISEVEDSLEEMMNAVEIPEEEQGYLGVYGETVPTSYISNYGYPAGVSITKITEGSPADKAGLQIYDIVTAVNGEAVESFDEMKSELNSYPAGTTITLTVERPEGRSFTEIELTATLVSESDLAS